MDKLQALDKMQELISSEYSRLDDAYEVSCELRHWQSCDVISEMREELKELYNFLEKEYTDE